MARKIANIRNRSKQTELLIKSVNTYTNSETVKRDNVVPAPMAKADLKNVVEPKPGPHDRVQEPDINMDDAQLFDSMRHEEVERIKSLQRELIKSQQMYDAVIGLEGRMKWRREIEKVKKEITRVKHAALLDMPLN